jgi:hypothetical protein
MTSSTRRSTGAMPFLTSQRPRPWRDARPTLPSRSKRLRESTRARLAWASGSRRQSWLFAAAGLNTGLFICRDHEVIGAQRDVLPNALVQVKDATGLCSKVGITREKPASMLPRAQRIAAEPAPQGSAADLRDQPLSNNVLADVGDREPGRGQSEAVRKLTGDRLNLNHEAGGKSGWEPHLVVAHPDRGSDSRKSVFATCSQSGAAYPSARRCDRWTDLALLARRSLPAPHHDMMTYISSLAPLILDAHLVTALLDMGSSSAATTSTEVEG